MIGSRWACSVLQGTGPTGCVAFFEAPFGRRLGGGASITGVVSGIIGAGEVFLVASNTGLLAVTLVRG